MRWSGVGRCEERGKERDGRGSEVERERERREVRRKAVRREGERDER